VSAARNQMPSGVDRAEQEIVGGRSDHCQLNNPRRKPPVSWWWCFFYHCRVSFIQWTLERLTFGSSVVNGRRQNPGTVAHIPKRRSAERAQQAGTIPSATCRVSTAEFVKVAKNQEPVIRLAAAKRRFWLLRLSVFRRPQNRKNNTPTLLTKPYSGNVATMSPAEDRWLVFLHGAWSRDVPPPSCIPNRSDHISWSSPEVSKVCTVESRKDSQ
jgi:hypothetical protein